MPKSKRKKSNRRKSRSGVRNTPISGHKRVGKKLVPPFGLMINSENNPWMDNRLPEMLWAALIVFSFERHEAFDQFLRITRFINEHGKREDLHDLTLTGIARLEDKLRDEVISVIAEPFAVAEALSSLRLFESLPAREIWLKNLPLIDPDPDLLKGAVGAALWHQSQNATDSRWMRLVPMVIAGKMKLQPDMVRRLIDYPGENDPEKTGGFIRSAEIARNPNEHVDLAWPNAFWNECWDKTPCIETEQVFLQPSFEDVISRSAVSEMRKYLLRHWKRTHTTTAVDAKHDAIFGMGFYSLRLLDEMMGINTGASILGRLGLRTILEIRINLKYLLDTDNNELWKKWREFGAGQAKLNAMKFRESIEPPEYIDLDSIEFIASEDKWEEMLTVELSSWSNLDLRKMSERSGLKDAYDQFYSWSSGYSHGMWGAIRESSYQVCGNPLHRLHRYPARLTLQDTVADATKLVDEIIQLIDNAYPRFDRRFISVSESKVVQ